MKLNFNLVGFKMRLFRTLHKILVVPFLNKELTVLILCDGW